MVAHRSSVNHTPHSNLGLRLRQRAPLKTHLPSIHASIITKRLEWLLESLQHQHQQQTQLRSFIFVCRVWVFIKPNKLQHSKGGLRSRLRLLLLLKRRPSWSVTQYNMATYVEGRYYYDMILFVHEKWDGWWWWSWRQKDRPCAAAAAAAS